MVCQAVLRGSVVGLCETHWQDADRDRWASAFPSATLVSAPAVRGPNSGSASGVAIVVPAQYEVKNESVLVPGCALACVLEDRFTALRFRVVVIYLPPTRREDVIAGLPRAFAEDLPSYFLGDWNFDLRQPRTDPEHALRSALFGWLGSCGSSVIDNAAVTRREGQ